LKEINIYDMPVYFILTRIDSVTQPEDVLNNTRNDICKIMGDRKFKLVVTSGRTGDIGDFIAFLKEINRDAGKLFIDKYKPVISEYIKRCKEYILKRLNTKSTIEEIDDELVRIDAELNEIDLKLTKESDELKNSTVSAIDKICDKVKNDVEFEKTNIVSMIADGQSFEAEKHLKQAVRVSIAEGIKMFYSPSETKFISNVKNIVPDNYNIDIDINATLTGINAGKTNSALFDVLDKIGGVFGLIGKLVVGVIWWRQGKIR